MLRSLFYLADVTRILKIPLAVGMMEDFTSWNHTKMAFLLFDMYTMLNGITNMEEN
jgi:hypothetical protein